MSEQGGQLVPIARAPLALTPDRLASLPPEELGPMVTGALEQSRGWLAIVTRGTDPTPVAQFRALAATVAEMVRQKNLAHDIQLDAVEMVRRAERGIGLTIRQGQEAGEIATRDEARVYAGQVAGALRKQQGGHPALLPERKPSPRDYADRGLLSSGGGASTVYSLSDGVTEDDFEGAISEGRVERNLSRANVARKAQGLADERRNRPVGERLAQITKLAGEAATSKQIAHEIGVGVEWVKELAKRHGIEIPADRSTARAQYTLDPQQVIGSTVDDIHNTTQVTDSLVKFDSLDDLDPEVMAEWVDLIDESVAWLRRLRKELRRAIDGGQRSHKNSA